MITVSGIYGMVYGNVYATASVMTSQKMYTGELNTCPSPK